MESSSCLLWFCQSSLEAFFQPAVGELFSAVGEAPRFIISSSRHRFISTLWQLTSCKHRHSNVCTKISQVLQHKRKVLKDESSLYLKPQKRTECVFEGAAGPLWAWCLVSYGIGSLTFSLNRQFLGFMRFIGSSGPLWAWCLVSCRSGSLPMFPHLTLRANWYHSYHLTCAHCTIPSGLEYIVWKYKLQTNWKYIYLVALVKLIDQSSHSVAWPGAAAAAAMLGGGKFFLSGSRQTHN